MKSIMFVFKALIFTPVRVNISETVLVSAFKRCVLNVVSDRFYIPKVKFSSESLQFPNFHSDGAVLKIMMSF